LGPQAAPAVDPLIATLIHSSFLPVRERAAWALSRIGPAAHRAAPALRNLTNSGFPRLSRLAISALESIRGMAA
jgi:HEAT repeat protein